MKNVKWSLLVYAILATASIIGIGIGIAEQSLIGVIGCIAAVIIIMGLGFTTRKKLREKGEL